MSTRMWLPRWLRRRRDDDFAREIDAHLAIEADRLIEEGLTPDAARLAARRRFGNVTAARERFHETGRLLWLDHLRQDVRSAVRNMRRAPLAAAVATLSLAGALGATTVTLSIRDIIFYKPPPLYEEPRQLSKIQVGQAERPILPFGSAVPAPLYAIWRDAFGRGIGAAKGFPGVRDVRVDDRMETAPVRAVTPGFFSLLGVSAELGRADVGSIESARDAAPAVLSYRLWQRLFDGRPDAVGRIIWIERQPFTVVGVLPARFWFGDMSSPAWVRLDASAAAPTDAFDVIVRRTVGTTPAMLEAQLRPGLADYAARQPAGRRNLLMKVSGIEGTPVGHQVAVVLPYVLGTSVLLTLLIACANVAILMIAQWTAREHEIAIRASIGGSRGRIVRSLLTESVLIALAGGLLGICATVILRAWVLRQGGPAGFFNLSMDPAIFLWTAAIALATGAAAGIAPALYETRQLHANPLRTIASSDRVRQRWRSALVVFEITVTVALLVETTAMIDGYQRARAGQMGFATESLMTARVENTRGVPAADVVDVVKQMPGVAGAAASTGLGLFGGSGQQVQVAGDATGRNAVSTDQTRVGEDYFSTLGVRMIVGRPFTEQDATARVAIVNETLARRVFERGDALANRVWIAQTPYDVVGVVADYTTNPLTYPDFEPQVFLPLPAWSSELTRLSVLVRAHGDPAPLTRTIRREIGDATAGTIVTGAYTVDQILSVIGQEILIGTAPLFPLIAIGMLLMTVGIYGVLAFAIARRSRELAVRLAIGATGADLVRLVSAQALRLVVVGAAIGIAVTFVLARVVRAGGAGGSIFDPDWPAFVVPVFVVLVIGALATWFPSRRASRIDPAALLRTT